MPLTMRARVCFAPSDGDWHDATRHFLEQPADRVLSGGVLAVHDDNAHGGYRKATDAFLPTRTPGSAKPTT